MIRLTDEEIKEATFGKEDYDNNIARAQLKKVVEWEFEICTNHQDSYAIGVKRIDCPECRQALLEEVK